MNEIQIQTRIDRYFRSASEKLVSAKAVKAYADTYVGASFNPYALLAPNEVAFSRILADLLDPKGSHAQGDKFLNLFLDTFSIDIKGKTSTATASIKREASINKNRRIDILLEFDNNIAVAIENKPWAREQDEQLDNYASFLKEKYKDFYLLFLYGSSVEQNTLVKFKELLEKTKRFQSIPLSGREGSISKWVHICSTHSRSIKINLYLEDLQCWIDGAC